MRIRRLLTCLAVVVIPALAIVVFYLGWALGRPYHGAGGPVFVTVQPRTPVHAIARQLAEAGVIRSQTAFILAHYLHTSRKLKAGEYEFDRPMSVNEVLGKLARGEVYYHAVTIPEGFNIYEIADAIARSGLATHDETMQVLKDPAPVADLDPSARTLEGYVFPDTYRFTRPASAKQMVGAMLSRFRRVYRELDNQHHPPQPVHQIVTMASLVEKETAVPGERPLVASVYYNRLRSGMRLQCDPTVIYAALVSGNYRGAIYQSDLASDSPYNTYTHGGLPAGPIASPGRGSLAAAMAPADTNFVYFVAETHDPQGPHHFSATLAEHARAVAAYRKTP